MLVRIAVTPDSKDSAKAIKETWGKRCNKGFFYTAEEGKPLIPVIRTPSKSAFGLLCDSIRNIVEEGEDFQWLLVTTETTFALPENLRYMLIQSLLSGLHFTPNWTGRTLPHWILPNLTTLGTPWSSGIRWLASIHCTRKAPPSAASITLQYAMCEV